MKDKCRKCVEGWVIEGSLEIACHDYKKAHENCPKASANEKKAPTFSHREADTLGGAND